MEDTTIRIPLSLDAITIRKIEVADASDFLALCRQLDEETKFMLLEPGERSTTIAQQTQRIRKILATNNQMVFVAHVDGRLVGYIAGLGGSYRRNSHKADIVIGILHTYTAMGLGTRLFEQLEGWARDRQLHKLELTVMEHNEPAISLYKKMGFTVEGVSVDSIRIEDRYVNELDMAKILNS